MFFESLIARRAVLVGIVTAGGGLNLRQWASDAIRQGYTVVWGGPGLLLYRAR